ncbi:MarR family winged helix-turn-helix transcriptional regulator [Spongiibacter sp.]|uniref:MarR family winged helix-turn-helix transcriptional regulator n=1 Tax=Spongiibacter sp. TaxID=2024860 RepID=UPI003565E474
MKKLVDQEQGYLIGTLAYALYWVDESLQKSLEAAGWERMNRTRSMIMLSVTAGINRPADMARNLGVSRQAIHQLLQGLKDENILELIADPKDKRAKIVQFSPEADAIRGDAQRIVVGIEEELKKRIGKTAFNGLRDALNRSWGPVVLIAPD